MISNENCVRPLTIFQSVSTFRVIALKPAALDCQSEMSSFLSKPLRYLFITQLKQNRSLQAKTVFPKIPTDYVDPFMGEGRGGECLHERIFLCRDFPALIASRSRHLARENACQHVTSFVLTLIGWNCILALWLAHFVFVNTVGQCDKNLPLFPDFHLCGFINIRCVLQ